MAPKRTKKSQYSEMVLMAAITSIREEGKSVREAARLHGVPRSTIQDRLQGKKSYFEAKKPVLSSSEEGRLVDWLTASAKRGFGKTKAQVLTTVQTMLNESDRKTPFKENKPGKTWFANFLRRHPDLSIWKPKALESQHTAMREWKVRGWFEIAYREISSVDADVLNQPSRIFSCDETVFQFKGGIVKGVARKNKRTCRVARDAHRQVTVLACGSASGDLLYPMLIFPGQRLSIDPAAGFPEAHVTKSPNGWIDSNIFTKWLEAVFIPAVRNLDKPVLLLVDGHKTYVNLSVSELCRDHNIILYQLPSHVSHLVRPLDLTSFKALKQSWLEEVSNYIEENCKTLGRSDFAKVLRKAWTHGIRRDAVVSGFRTAGIYPWDPDHVNITKLRPSRQFTETCQTEMVTSDNFKEINLVPGETTEIVTSDNFKEINLVSGETIQIVTSDNFKEINLVSGETTQIVTSDNFKEINLVPGETTQIVTSDNFKEINLVSGETATDVQKTDKEPPDDNDIVTDENTAIPLSPSISLDDDPPSPSTQPSAQPSLPTSSERINASDAETEIAMSTPLFSLVTSTTVQQGSYPNSPTTNDQTPVTTSIPLQHDTTPLFDFELTLLETQDRLIDLTAISGPQKLIQYRTIHDSKTETNDFEAQHFCALYSRLRRFIHDKTNNRHDECRNRTFDNLQLQHDTTPLFDVELTLLETLDRLIDLTAISGPQKLIHYRTIHDSKTEANDFEAQHFCSLYSRLRRFIHDKTNNRNHECRNRTFDNLPLPFRQSGKSMRMTFQPSKTVTSDSIRESVTDSMIQKKRKDEEKDNRKKDWERKRKISEERKQRKNICHEEKERKKISPEEKERNKNSQEEEERSQNQEKKTKEYEERKAKVKVVTRRAQVKNKRTKKQKETSDTDSTDTECDSLESITSSKCVEDDDDINFEDVEESLNSNVCYGCMGEIDEEMSDWVGCECGRWFQFHENCVFELLRGKSVHEIQQLTYVCQICEKKENT